MNNKLLFVFDLDGIIIDSENKIKNDIMEKLIEASQKGNIISVFSRKSYVELFDVLQKIKNYIDYFVGLNGAIIVNFKTNTKIRTSKTLDYSFLKLVLNDVKELKGSCKIMTSNEVYTNHYQLYSNDFVSSITYNDGEKAQVSNFNFLDIYENPNLFVLQITILLPEGKDEIFKEFINNYYGCGYTCNFTEEKLIDVNVKGVSKYNSLLKLIKMENINIRNVFIFANSNSSLKIIESFSNAYIMDNLEKETISYTNNKIIPIDDTQTICFEITSILKSNH